jgi:23S rRNA maturation-related 3'-5' exoribonuclease YhaM
MRAKGIRTLNQKQPQMHKSECRNMKQQDNRSSSRPNSIIKELNNGEEEEISNIEIQKVIVKMINEFKEKHKS